ncbi:pectin lyase-like protein [Aspergillus tetrazonus]
MHVWRVIWLIGQLGLLVQGSHHHHQHDHLHTKYHSVLQKREQSAVLTSGVAPVSTTSVAPVPQETSDAADAVARALRVLRTRNKLRLEHVQYNKYEMGTSSEVHPALDSAPLDYSQKAVRQADTENSSEERHTRRDSGSSDKEAAKVIAESTPPSPSTGNHSAVAALMDEKYGTGIRDTFVPSQAFHTYNGLSQVVLDENDSVLASDNGTEGDLKKRASSSWWMATMTQRGSSPYAPSGYKIWRNVMDYGAKGDGVTDDTAAINLAISDDGRCGANCGSSTIYPAVVYFPPGNYLVSSPIIQYYNTQLIGDPLDLPTILGATSFVGLGVITSDVYVGDQEEWYINTNNFLRSVRNFKIDITRTDQNAYICAIHWQVAQGTSLENIYFYMTQDASTTQQGIYMENGSGGFMSDLTFVGGNFGAYLGNQQFTTSHLVFVNCNIALQIHWDWAWTMQDVVIESCRTGIIIAGGPFSTGQGVGSFALVDAITANTATGITTTLYNENSTALFLQNVGFYNTKNAIMDNNVNKALIPGGDQTILDSWGFGMVNDPQGARFVSDINLLASNRSSSLVGNSIYNIGQPNFFTRRRPNILARGANMSSIVFFPYGVYVIKDTLKIPRNSRILGQAWSQIMATGSRFEDARNPRVAVKVGNAGDVGIVEIQDLLFTVSGPTAGAVLVEWNIHESAQGSAGLWDSNFRVGGAAGSDLQAKDCPKESASVNKSCIAAALMLRLTYSSSAYLEIVWVWTADHDLDVVSQDQVDVYSARGILIESQGPTWLYGTASEHQVFYQYELYQAKDIVLGMIQTESPYYQPVPPAPQPFTPGLFPGDPDFSNCTVTSTACPSAWGMRILDSSSVHLLGAGFYSWFSDYSQDCVDKDYCQDRIFQIEESYDVWIYNLVTKAISEMVSPVGEVPTYAKDNKNGFLSSLFAWVRGPKEVIGSREIRGFCIWDSNSDSDALKGLPNACKTSLTQLVKCDPYALMFLDETYRGSLENATLTDSVCDESCAASLKSWFDNVDSTCAGYNVSGSAATKYGGQVWSGWNETCLRDSTSGEYCNDVIAGFSAVDFLQDMPKDELCSFCFVEILEMMQRSSYSFYDKGFQSQLGVVNEQCGLSAPTAMPPSLDAPPEFPPDPICSSYQTHTTVSGDTCDSIALTYSVSSAALVMANPRQLMICDSLPADMELCLPTSCSVVYQLKGNDTCSSIERAASYSPNTVRRYNPWVAWDCSNLQATTEAWGHVICLGGQGGNYTATAPIPGVTLAPGESNSGYSESVVDHPSNATVAEGTTLKCGKWHVAAEGESCVQMCLEESITFTLFVQVNPSLAGSDCSTALVVGNAYCVAPNSGWSGSQVPVASSSVLPIPIFTSS